MLEDVKYLKVSACVRFWEDAEVNGVEDIEGSLIPCRKGDCWEPLISTDTGQILNWVKGNTANLSYKVCDEGTYTLLNEKEAVLAKMADEYVPDAMSPADTGYGDYIYMEIDADGFIKDWNPDFSNFADFLEE